MRYEFTELIVFLLRVEEQTSSNLKRVNFFILRYPRKMHFVNSKLSLFSRKK